LKLRKLMGVTLILSMVIVTVLFTGLASAANANDLPSSVLTSTLVYPGEETFARIMINNTLNNDVMLTTVGVHFSWMADNAAKYADISNGADAYITNHTDNHFVGPINITIPDYVIVGQNYTCFATISGVVLDSSGNGVPFSINYSPQDVTVFASPYATSTPTSTPVGGGGVSSSWLLYAAVVAVVAVVVAALLLLLQMRKKPKKNVAESAKPAAEKPKPASDQPLENSEGGGI
jgi:hypothetical protein